MTHADFKTSLSCSWTTSCWINGQSLAQWRTARWKLHLSSLEEAPRGTIFRDASKRKGLYLLGRMRLRNLFNELRWPQNSCNWSLWTNRTYTGCSNVSFLLPSFLHFIFSYMQELKDVTYNTKYFIYKQLNAAITV